jgi:hypothetical protein
MKVNFGSWIAVLVLISTSTKTIGDQADWTPFIGLKTIQPCRLFYGFDSISLKNPVIRNRVFKLNNHKIVELFTDKAHKKIYYEKFYVQIHKIKNDTLAYFVPERFIDDPQPKQRKPLLTPLDRKGYETYYYTAGCFALKLAEHPKLDSVYINNAK